MKKLLYTTAIAGLAMTYATVSSAETKISGNVGLSYFASDDSLPKATNKSLDGFGKESQLNISKSGDLNNGMKYAAGFSFEFDGADAQSEAQTAENVHIDFISGNTTIDIGADHFQNTDVTMTNLVGFGYLGADGASADKGSLYPTNGSNYAAYGIGLLQKTDIGSIGINFTPNNTASLAANDIANGLKKSQVNGNAATEITFRGSLGVKGLDVLLGKKFEDKGRAADTMDRDSHRVAAKYSVGKFSIAADTITRENASTPLSSVLSSTNGTSVTFTNTAAAASNETKGKSIGIAYSITDNLSIGYTRSEAEVTTAGSSDEETDMVAIGYNLGAVSVQAQYKDVENLGGVAANDGKLFGLYLGTKF